MDGLLVHYGGQGFVRAPIAPCTTLRRKCADPKEQIWDAGAMYLISPWLKKITAGVRINTERVSDGKYRTE